MKVRSSSKSVRSTKRGRPAAVAAAARAKTGKSRRRNPLILQSECTLASAAELKETLCELLGRSGTVALDGAAVERIDTATLQLLAAFVRDRRLAGGTLQWRATSPALRSAAQLLGMEAMLLLNEATP